MYAQERLCYVSGFLSLFKVEDVERKKIPLCLRMVLSEFRIGLGQEIISEVC